MGNGNGDKDGTNEAGVGDENGNRDEGRRGHRANEGDTAKEVAWLLTPKEVRQPCDCIRRSQKRLGTLSLGRRRPCGKNKPFSIFLGVSPACEDVTPRQFHSQ